MSRFKTRVIEIVCAIPKGKVLSYGQVAAYAGLPMAAREVGWILHTLGSDDVDIPWWRVVNNKGYLSIRGNQRADKELQAKLLRAEGVEVDHEFTLNMISYRYLPNETALRSFSTTGKSYQDID